jgi:hypothetical protein
VIGSEWTEVLALMRLNWPNAKFPPRESREKWYADLKHLPAQQVKVAVEAMYRDGREFPPNGAQILAKVTELARDDISHGRAWELAKRAALKADPKLAAEWLRERSPEAQAAVEQLCSAPQLTYQLGDESTVRAQFRDVFKSVLATQKRDDLYAGLPSAGLRGLERGPQKLGSALKRALPERVG